MVPTSESTGILSQTPGWSTPWRQLQCGDREGTAVGRMHVQHSGNVRDPCTVLVRGDAVPNHRAKHQREHTQEEGVRVQRFPTRLLCALLFNRFPNTSPTRGQGQAGSPDVSALQMSVSIHVFTEQTEGYLCSRPRSSHCGPRVTGYSIRTMSPKAWRSHILQLPQIMSPLANKKHSVACPTKLTFL